MQKIQTLAEMEAESLDGFRNPVLSQEEEAKFQRTITEKIAQEKAREHRIVETDAKEHDPYEDDDSEDVDGN